MVKTLPLPKLVTRARYDALHLLPGDALREAVEVLKTESYEEYCAKLLGMGIENPNHYAVYLHSKEDVADMRDFQRYIIPQVREAYENHVLRPDFGIRNTSAEMSVMQK